MFIFLIIKRTLSLHSADNLIEIPIGDYKIKISEDSSTFVPDIESPVGIIFSSLVTSPSYIPKIKIQYLKIRFI